jgi:hypothetical protein
MSVEADIQERLVNWVETNYPNVEYRIDLADKQKSGNWPDIFIAQTNLIYTGLFLEVKVDISEIFNNKGSFVSSHVIAQNMVHRRLREQGFCAEFVVGLQHGLELLNWYFELPLTQEEKLSPLSVMVNRDREYRHGGKIL